MQALSSGYFETLAASSEILSLEHRVLLNKVPKKTLSSAEKIEKMEALMGPEATSLAVYLNDIADRKCAGKGSRGCVRNSSPRLPLRQTPKSSGYAYTQTAQQDFRG